MQKDTEIKVANVVAHHDKLLTKLRYRTRAIITRGLYIFYPLFEVQKLFSRGFFVKILALCIQERVMMARVRYMFFEFCKNCTEPVSRVSHKKKPAIGRQKRVCA